MNPRYQSRASLVILSDFQIKMEAVAEGTAENGTELVERWFPARQQVTPMMDRENRFSGLILL